MKYLKNKQFIGDLSLQDADILCQYASQSKSILEFGAGGSTQLLAQSNADLIISVETDAKWIEITKQRLALITNATPVTFVEYTTQFQTQFDLILVDGIDHLRKDFAIETWKYLKPNGIMIFHDTHRFQDFQNAAWVAQLYFNEIKRIDVNAAASNGASSNMTVLHKKLFEPYVNWNLTESKPQWTYGTLDDNLQLWHYNDCSINQQDELKIHSQNGEDGIIEKIFRYVKSTNRIAVEFGVSAGGGLETNTRALSEQGWQTFWFDVESATDLPKNCIFKQVLLTRDNISTEFESQKIPKEFDLLSIDVDGNDYHLREALSFYNPRVCVMEYNGSIPADQEYIMPYDERYQWSLWQKNFGASLLSLTNQADKLGYDLVYCESRGVNAFFIRRDINVFPVKTATEAYKKLWWDDQ
jgi:hypothetical protein